MPNDLPPWEIVCQQTQRWLKAGVFENMVHDLRVRPAAFLDFAFPVLYICSPIDRLPSTAAFERAMAGRPNCRMVVLEGVNHWFPEQHPQRVLGKIRAFFAQPTMPIRFLLRQTGLSWRKRRISCPQETILSGQSLYFLANYSGDDMQSYIYYKGEGLPLRFAASA